MGKCDQQRSLLRLSRFRPLMTTASLRVCRVAVVDDDYDTATATAAVLCRSGLRAAVFSTVVSLLEACNDEEFDAFVLDWQLADSTSLDLVRTLRARDQSARAPIFLLSGSLAVKGLPCDSVMAQAIKSYDLRYRLKPYSPLRLAQELLATLHQRAA